VKTYEFYSSPSTVSISTPLDKVGNGVFRVDAAVEVSKQAHMP